MKIQRQPSYPAIPFIFAMAKARSFGILLGENFAMMNKRTTHTTDSSGHDTGAKKQAESPLKLVSFIVHGNEVNTSREETCFEYADNKSHRNKASKIADKTLSNRGDT